MFKLDRTVFKTEMKILSAKFIEQFVTLIKGIF